MMSAAVAFRSRQEFEAALDRVCELYARVATVDDDDARDRLIGHAGGLCKRVSASRFVGVEDLARVDRAIGASNERMRGFIERARKTR